MAKTTEKKQTKKTTPKKSEVNPNDFITEEYVTNILAKLGYKKYRAGTEFYFLPHQGKIKFSTKLGLNKAKELFRFKEE